MLKFSNLLPHCVGCLSGGGEVFFIIALDMPFVTWHGICFLLIENERIEDSILEAKYVAWIAATWMETGECPYDRVDRIFDNDSENGIPQICVPNILITQDNLQEEVIDKGIASAEDIEQIAQTYR